MNEFGKIFRQERVSKRKTLREIGEYVGLSIGYLSDVEHGRRRPPDLEKVALIEEFFGVTNRVLSSVAERMRSVDTHDIAHRVMLKPKLQELLLRADEDLDESEIDQVIKEIVSRRQK